MSSMWRRALRVAQSNLSDLASRASTVGRGKSLEDLSDDELEAELERRRKEHTARAAVKKARDKAAERTGTERERSRAKVSTDGTEFLDLPPQKRRQVRQYYANLELPYGADLDQVKKAYRRLMRQYHPDRHQEDPARRKLATQLSQKLTVAYNELNILLKNRNK